MKKNILIAMLAIGLLGGFINSTNKLIKVYGSVKTTGPFRPIRSENDSENVYFTVLNTETGQVWNNDSKDFVDTDAASVIGANYGNIAISATDVRAQAEDGWMPEMPAEMDEKNSNFEADVTLYSNATPAATDEALIGRHCYIKATKIGDVYKCRIHSMDDL